MRLLDRLGKRYGQRPSAWVPGADPALALSLDLACMAEGEADVAEVLSRAPAGAIQHVRILGGG